MKAMIQTRIQARMKAKIQADEEEKEEEEQQLRLQRRGAAAPGSKRSSTTPKKKDNEVPSLVEYKIDEIHFI